MVDKPSKPDDMLATMRSRLAIAVAAYSESRQTQLEDMKFFAGNSDNLYQWDKDVARQRTSANGQTSARPCLTVNKLPQHVRQVTNDQRQNRPTGKVIPVDDKADVKVAEILNGIVKHVEYISDADVAYDTACENQTIHGEGYVRLVTEYCDDSTFDQDIKIKRVRNPFSVYLDPMAQDPCGADAQWGFVSEDLTIDEYHRLWPDASSSSTLLDMGTGDRSVSQWVSERTVRIVEYFYITHEERKLNLYPNNQTAFDGSADDRALRLMFGDPLRSRKSDKKVVKWVKSNGFEDLQSTTWPGRHIPIVRVIGNEFEIDGRIEISGLVRNAKDPQRMYNYWVSQEAEMLALAPKAPFIGYAGQFEGFEQQWKTANTQNWPYLEVNADATDGQGNPLPLPQRAQPPMASSGLLQAKAGAAEDVKSATGQYDASLGMVSNERSGRAIIARQKEGDTGTYHYVDNLARAVRYVTRQIVDLVPQVYDTARVARIIGEDGSTKSARIDPRQPEPMTQVVDEQGVVLDTIYNPGVGRYDVVVISGPGYATKRQEALEAMAQLLQGNPDLWKVAGDLFVKNMDWPGAQEMSKRFAKAIPPEIMSDEDESPALQSAKMQMQTMAQEMEQMHQMLQNVQTSMEARELEIKEFEAETKRIAAVQDKMTPEQIQDIVMGTIAAAMDNGMLDKGADEVPQMGAPMVPEGPQ